MNEQVFYYVAVKEFFPRDWVSRDAITSNVVEFPEACEKRKIVEKCLQSFRHEAAVLETMKDTPYIARLRDKFTENGTEYLVLNMVQGPSLTTYVKEITIMLPLTSDEETLQQLAEEMDGLIEAVCVPKKDLSGGYSGIRSFLV